MDLRIEFGESMLMSGPSGRGQVLESTIAMIFSPGDGLAGDRFGKSRTMSPKKISFSCKIRDIFYEGCGV
jgi:ABC-type iron transport system FetAB ATPase subunit